MFSWAGSAFWVEFLLSRVSPTIPVRDLNGEGIGGSLRIVAFLMISLSFFGGASVSTEVLVLVSLSILLESGLLVSTLLTLVLLASTFPDEASSTITSVKGTVLDDNSCPKASDASRISSSTPDTR